MASSKQSWDLALGKLPQLEAQNKGQIHQALERATAYFVQHVEPPKNKQHLRELLDTLERWHEEGVMDTPPQESPPPGWLLLQAAIMSDDKGWTRAMMRDTQASHQMACSSALASTSSFANSNKIPLNPAAIKRLWTITLSLPLLDDPRQARDHLVRAAQWFNGAGLDESHLSKNIMERLEILADKAGYDGNNDILMPGIRTDNLLVLAALKRSLLSKQATSEHPITDVKRKPRTL